MPSTSPIIREQIGFRENISAWEDAGKWGMLPAGLTVKKGEIIFPRIDLAKELEILAEQNTAPQTDNNEDPAGVALIGIEDFTKVTLTVAKITACEPVKKAKKLLCLTLDDGTAAPRTVASGIAQWYKPEDLTGRSVVLVANLKPAVLCGIESQGMMKGALPDVQPVSKKCSRAFLR